MALSWLYTEVMVVISEPWVKDGEAAKAAIDSLPHLAALLPQLQKAHAGLFEVKAKESPNLRDLSQRESKADAKHDAYVKGMYGTLTMLAPISSAPQELLDLRLFDMYNEWQSAAQLLGQLEDERARLNGASPTVAGEVSAARNRWIRVAITGC